MQSFMQLYFPKTSNNQSLFFLRQSLFFEKVAAIFFFFFFFFDFTKEIALSSLLPYDITKFSSFYCSMIIQILRL